MNTNKLKMWVAVGGVAASLAFGGYNYAKATNTNKLLLKYKERAEMLTERPVAQKKNSNLSYQISLDKRYSQLNSNYCVHNELMMFSALSSLVFLLGAAKKWVDSDINAKNGQ